MSPFGDIAVWVQRWNGSPLMKGDGLPEIPRVNSTFPSSVHWRTVWSPSSVSQTVSSGAMKMPCARGNSPSPNERRKLPSRSNTIIGCSPRLKTKTLSFLSTPTPPISLNDQPGGSFAQFSTGSYEYAPLPTVVMPRPPCSLPVGKLVTKQKVSASPSAGRTHPPPHRQQAASARVRSRYGGLFLALPRIGSIVYSVTGNGAHSPYMKVLAHTLVPLPDETQLRDPALEAWS